MSQLSTPLLLILALSLTGCAAISVAGGVASLGVSTVTTAGSLALTGAGVAAKAGSAILPSGKHEPEPQARLAEQ